MNQTTAFKDALINVDSESGQAAWKLFLFNVTKVRELDAVMDDHTAHNILQAGLRWQGGGWNTTTASRTLFDVCGIPLVSSTFDHYRDAWIYGCALHWKVDVPEFSLTEGAAAAAFALAGACSAGGAEDGAEEEEEEDPAPARFPWEEQQQKLPEELKVLWKRFGSGEEKFELKVVLDRIPRYQCLPPRPPENNHWQDGKSKADKALKAQQQSLLHSLRLQAWSYEVLQSLIAAPPQDVKERYEVLKALMQQHWGYSASLYQKTQMERREFSLPGIGAGAGDEVLFGKEEIQQMNLKSKVQSMRRTTTGNAQTFSLGPYSFRSFPVSGKGSFRAYGYGSRSFGGYGNHFKGGKGAGRSQRGGAFCKDRGFLHFSGAWCPLTLFPQGEECFSSLGEDGSLPRSDDIDNPRRGPQLDFEWPIQGAPAEALKRPNVCTQSATRLSFSGGSVRGISLRLAFDRTFRSLVCVGKKGALWGSK